MDIRLYTDADLELFNDWREAHKSVRMYGGSLPETGLVVQKEGRDIAIGFLVRTDTNICILCYPVVNPKVHRDVRKVALDYLVKAAIEWVELSDFEILYTWSGMPLQVKRLESNGFSVYDTNVTHLFRCKNE